MQTSVAKQVFDHDILCTAFGFDAVMSNKFAFPVPSGTLESGHIDSAFAMIGTISPIQSIVARYISGTTSISLINELIEEKVLINFDGDGNGVVAADKIVSRSTATLAECIVNSTINVKTFYDLYIATKAIVDSYASNLDDLLEFAIMQLANLTGSNTISSTKWGYLHNLNQELTQTSDVNFKSVIVSTSIGTPGIVVPAAAQMIVSGGISTSKDLISTTGKVQAQTDVVANTGNVQAANNVRAINGDIYTTAITDYSGSVAFTNFTATIKKIWYKVVGKTVFCNFEFEGKANAGSVNIIKFTLPVTPTASKTVGMAIAQNDSGTGIDLVPCAIKYVSGTTTFDIHLGLNGGTSYANLNSTTWKTGTDSVKIHGSFFFDTSI